MSDTINLISNMCDICSINPMDFRTKCLNGHIICIECYMMVDKCPFCRIPYRLSLCCKFDNNHEEKGSENDIYYRDVIYPDGVVESLLEAIKFQTYMTSDFSDCEDGDGTISIYNVSLKTSMFLNELFSDYYKNINHLFDQLPDGVKLYLSNLKAIDREKWESKFQKCLRNLIVRFGSGDHIKYVIDNSSDNLIRNKLYTAVCTCIADEYILYQIIQKQLVLKFSSEYEDTCDNFIDIYSTNLNINHITDLTILYYPRKPIRDYFENLSNYDRLNLMEVSLCDWFEKFTIDQPIELFRV